MEGSEREEGWRHGNSGLAFNVPCGVSEDTRAREATSAQADSKRALRRASGKTLLLLPSVVFRAAVIDAKVTRRAKERKREEE